MAETNARKRPISFTEASAVETDDFLLIDGQTSGTRKIKPDKVGKANTSDLNNDAGFQNATEVAAAIAANIDAGLDTEGKAADSKAVGDALATKVDAASGKGLSTNDYTTAEKTKLAGVATGATRVLIDSGLSESGKAADAAAVGTALDGKVDKVAGKGIVAVDSTLTQTGQAADAKATGDEITHVKQDISELESDLDAAKVNKPATNPDGTNGQLLMTNGDGTTQWTNQGTPTAEQVETAVDDWLDEHPEATTTVEDGSLTLQKFSDNLKLATVNDYATPEMYGAVGDGTTDDTAAIKAMLASGKRVYVFSKANYKISEPIDFSGNQLEIYFDNTVFTASHIGALLEYVVAFKSQMTHTVGSLKVMVGRHAYIGIWLGDAKGSVFDTLFVQGAIIWGLYMDDNSDVYQGSILINELRITTCGVSYPAKGKYSSNTQLQITDIDYSNYTTSFTDEQKEVLFGGDYKQILYAIDDSGYTYTYQKGALRNRMVLVSSLAKPITLDENNKTQGVFDIGTSAYKVRSDYNDGDNGRKIWILIGGGIKVGSAASAGVFNINVLLITSCSKAIDYGFPYGGHIGAFATESCNVGICARSIVWGLNIDYIYLESIGNSFTNTDKSKGLFLISNNYNTKVIVGSGIATLDRENVVVVDDQQGDRNRQTLTFIQQCGETLSVINAQNANTYFGVTVTEETPREITINSSGFSTVNTVMSITLDLAVLKGNVNGGFSPVKAYVRNSNASANSQKFRIGMKNNLINNGYTINGAVSNVLTIDGGALGNNFVVTIVLFNKTFFVTAEALTYVDNTV